MSRPDPDRARLGARGIAVTFAARGGQVASLTVTDAGRKIAPLHRAPWVGSDEPMPDDAAPHLAWLGGDFLCAPFARSDGASGMHGWPANGDWTVTAHDGATLTARLALKVMGATVTKVLALRDGHPFLYQRHVFEGGAGRLPAANHACVAVPDGALVRTSPKRRWETPAAPPEPDPTRGRTRLRYPARGEAGAFPGEDGPVDLTRYPWGPRHEAFVCGLEAPGHALGWTAVTRPAQGDLFVSLRDPRTAPMTMLWHSNGGRDYAPWSGRHVGCLGVEEGAADHMIGPASAADLTGPGALPLGGTVVLRLAIGAIAWPTGAPVADMTPGGASLVVTGEDGSRRTVPFAPADVLGPG